MMLGNAGPWAFAPHLGLLFLVHAVVSDFQHSKCIGLDAHPNGNQLMLLH